MKTCKILKKRQSMFFLIAAGVFIVAVALSACNRRDRDGIQAPNDSMYSYQGTVFRYAGREHDLFPRTENIDAITNCTQVGKYIVIEAHGNPKNNVYSFFNTETESFEKDIFGANLIWYDDNIDTAVYSFWSGVYTYDGKVLAEFDLSESDFIKDLEFSEDYTKVIVTIETADTIQEEMIRIPHITASEADTQDRTARSGENEAPQPINIINVADAGYADFQEMNEAVGFDRYLEAAGFGNAEPYYLFEDENSGRRIRLELYFDEATGCGCGLEYTRRFNYNANGFEMSIQSFEIKDTDENTWEERDYRKLETYLDRYTPEDLVGIWDGKEPEEIKETIQYDEAGRMTSYLATGEISEYREEGDMMLMRFNYEYREDGSLFRREFGTNSLLFGGTWFSGVNSLFDEAERVLHESAYVTHGHYEMFYIYKDDGRMPKYILNVDHYPDVIDVGMERCKAPADAANRTRVLF